MTVEHQQLQKELHTALIEVVKNAKEIGSVLAIR